MSSEAGRTFQARAASRGDAEWVSARAELDHDALQALIWAVRHRHRKGSAMHTDDARRELAGFPHRLAGRSVGNGERRATNLRKRADIWRIRPWADHKL